jgi:hypothetical protein
MHTDKFGRKWKFEPGHDADAMLKLTHKVAAVGYNAHHALQTGVYEDRYAERLKDYPDMEPYLLKSGYGWHMGMRYGNEGSNYISPGIDNGIINLMIALHRRSNAGGISEMQAIWELVDGDDPL